MLFQGAEQQAPVAYQVAPECDTANIEELDATANIEELDTTANIECER